MKKCKQVYLATLCVVDGRLTFIKIPVHIAKSLYVVVVLIWICSSVSD